MLKLQQHALRTETTTQGPCMDGLTLATTLAQIAWDKKGEDLVILDLRERHSLIDYFVIVTARNARHGKVIGEDALARIKQLAPGTPRHLETADDWILGDFTDVVLHVFTEEARVFYDLEHLWADAPRVAWSPSEAGPESAESA